MFVIKHNGMYFQGFKDYSSIEGYLDKKHPKRTFKYCKNQHQAMEFISYEKAHDFKYKNNVLGTVTLIQETSKQSDLFKPNTCLVFTKDNDCDNQLLIARDEIENMIGTSLNNFYHMQKDILKVKVSTLNRFLNNPYKVNPITRKKIIDNLKTYFEGAKMAWI